MRIIGRLLISAVGIAAAASVSSIGPAHAWVHSEGHAGSGVISNGKVLISIKNTLPRDITCSYIIFPGDSAPAVIDGANQINTAFKKLDAGDTDGYRTGMNAGLTTVGQAGRVLTHGDNVIVAPGSTKTVTYSPDGTPAAKYAGYTLCQEQTTANGAPTEQPTYTSVVKYDQDASGFDIKQATGGGSGGAWGSLEGVLPF